MSLRDCSRYRPWLGARAAAAGADTVPAPELPAGLDLDAHLVACRACRTEVEELALLSFAIRRAWQETADVEPPADAWPLLRARIARRPGSRGWAASSLAGIALGMALTIGMVVPIGAGTGVPSAATAVLSEAGVDPDPYAGQRARDDGLERRWLLLQVAQGRPHASAAIDDDASVVEREAPRGPLSPRREQMRYAEDPAREAAAWLPRVPPMRAL